MAGPFAEYLHTPADPEAWLDEVTAAGLSPEAMDLARALYDNSGLKSIRDGQRIIATDYARARYDSGLTNHRSALAVKELQHHGYFRTRGGARAITKLVSPGTKYHQTRAALRAEAEA